MAVDVNAHKAVVVVNEGQHSFGFTTIGGAVSFLEEQIPEDGNGDKTLGFIAGAANGDAIVIDSTNFVIYNLVEWLDLYGPEDDEV